MTNVELADLGIRLLILGQYSIVIASVLLTLRNRFGVWLIILSLGILSYLYISSAPIEAAVPGLLAPAYLLSLSMPWIFWFFIKEGFELQLSVAWVWCSWLLLILPKWIMVLYFADLWPDMQLLQRDLRQLAGIVIVVHALFHLLKGYSDDLVEKRRLLRKALGVCTGFTILAVMAVELGLGFETQEAGLDIYASATIAILTLLFGPPITSYSREVFSESGQPLALRTVLAGESAQSQAQRQLQARLISVMEEGAYSDAGLTIGSLAEMLKLPEHQLRKLINTELGYRNFSAFVQQYRINEVCRQLQNPEKARIPILTLALDAGFGSLGPFNRAFKSLTGMTPSEYRDNPPADTGKV